MQFLLTNSRFLSLGVLLCFGATFGQTYFFGVFQEPISAEYGLTPGSFGLIYLGVTVAGAVTLSGVGHLIDRLPLTAYIAGLWLALLAACLAFASAEPVWLIFPAMFLVRLTGQGLMIHAAMTSMSRYFDAGRGRAVAVAGLGIPLGQAILPALALAIMAGHGWRTAFTVMPLVLVAIALPLSLWCLRGQKARHARWLADQSDEDAAALHLGTRSRRRRDMLRDPYFYRLLPTVFAVPFWVTGYFFFAVQVADSAGLTLLAFSELYWVYGLTAGIVPILTGTLVDRLGGRRLVFLPPPLIAVASTALLLADGTMGAAVYLIFLGLAGGMSLPINNALWAELYGTRYLGEIKATANALAVLSTALAPALLGAGFDIGVDIEAVYGAAVLWTVVAGIILFGPAIRRP